LRKALIGTLAMMIPTLALAWQAGMRASAGAWSDHHAPDATEVQYPLSALLSGNGKLFSTQTRFQGEVWLGNHAFFAADKVAALREANVEIPVAGGFLRLGRQILPWGRADQINPTDSLVSRNWQWRTATDDEQRIGNDGVEAVLPMRAYTISGVWLASMRSTRLPFINGLQSVSYSAIDRRSNLGVRIDRTGERIDWGVSLFQGADVSPSLSASFIAIIPQLFWRNYAIRRVGGDFAANLGKATVRGEIAYTNTVNDTVPTPTSLPGQKADYLKIVLGGDRDLSDGLNVNLQWVGQHLYGNAATGPPAVGAAQQLILTAQALVNQQPVLNLNGLAFRVQQRACNDMLRLELSGLAYSSGQGSLVRVRVTYQFDDSLAAVLGANRYFGPADGIMGALKPNNTWFVQLQYSI
jgi:hypothetical protein